MKNWKTTSAGLGIIGMVIITVVFAIHGGHGWDMTVWTGALTGLIGGFGLIVAGDAGSSASADDLQALHDKIDEITTRIQTGGK